MLQKYQLARDHSRQTLTIKEYAIIDKRLKNVKVALLRPEDYALLHEATYDSSAIESALNEGVTALVAALRTPFFYPNASNAASIAESVATLYNGKGDTEVELFFDDNSSPSETAADTPAA